MDLIVTVNELTEAALCACRMTDYAKPEEKLLITRLTSADGTLVRLILDRRCLPPEVKPHDTS